MKSLGDILRDTLHHHADRETPGSGARAREEESPYLLLGQKAATPEKSAGSPSREEVLNYLGELAKDYHLPPKLVYAVADAESGVNPETPPHPNYLKRNGKIVHKDGNPVIKNWDYGMMQVNSSNINKGEVKDAHGHAFKIGEDVKSDWRANVRAGVALLAPAYKFAEWEQPPGSTAEDRAQQAYSQYNGTPQTHDRYLKQGRDGLPQNGADRNFLEKYRRW